MIKFFQLKAVFGRDSGSSQSNGVEAAQLVEPTGDEEGGQVLAEAGVALKEGEPTDSRELMDAGVASNEHVVLYSGVAANQRAVGQNDVVADLGVMADVAAGHKQVIGADDCGFLLGVGAVNGDVFPKGVARTDNRLRRLAGIAGILGRITDDASGMEDVVLS